MSSTPFVRIAAIADLHVRSRDDLSYLADAFHDIDQVADILLLAGDITNLGRVAEMELMADVLQQVHVPIFVTLGNHDRRGMRRTALKRVLRRADAIVLEGSGAIVQLASGHTIGIGGVTGTGGGFKTDDEEFGPSLRFARAMQVKSRRESARLRKVLRELREQQPDLLVAMSHFAPTTSTLGDEPPLKYWMLGNALLGKTIDDFRPALMIHGHAHLGNEYGATEAGVPVLNVALPVTGGMKILDLDSSGLILASHLRVIASAMLELPAGVEGE